jgi:hypothetical protein
LHGSNYFSITIFVHVTHITRAPPHSIAAAIGASSGLFGDRFRRGWI